MRFISTCLGINSTYRNLTSYQTIEPPTLFIFLLGLCMSIFTILSNLFTITLLLRYRPMQKSISNMYILSLSVADMLIGLMIFMFIMAHMISFGISPFDEAWICKLWQLADFFLSTVSLYSICAIAFDRVWNLEKPLRVFKRSRKLARQLILIIWLLPLLVWIPFYSILELNPSMSCSLQGCTAQLSAKYFIPAIVAIPVLYVPAVALVAMFVRISVVVHGHLSFLREHSNNPLGSPAGNSYAKPSSREGTPFSRTPEATKKMSDSSLTSGYGTLRMGRSPSPRYAKAELTPLSEERSSGRERSQSEQLSGRIQAFEVDSTNHLKVKSTTSNPTRRESLNRAVTRQAAMSQRGEHFVFAQRAVSFSRNSIRRFSALSRNGSKRFSVIGIPGNLADMIQREGVSQQVRAAKAVALILFCFLVCWLPFLTLWPIKLFCRDCVPDWTYALSLFLNYLCSALNPLLYTLSSPRVRMVMTSYLPFCWGKSQGRFRNGQSCMKSGTVL